MRTFLLGVSTLAVTAALHAAAPRPGCAAPPIRASATPLVQVRMQEVPAEAEVERFDTVVSRNENGGLGVVVDQDNTVVTVTAQPSLKVGDVIVGVDGDELAGRPVGRALKPGAPTYTFTVARPSAADAASAASSALERALVQLSREAADRRRDKGELPYRAPGVLRLDEERDGASAARAAELVRSLEEAEAGSPAPALAEALGGFWRLVLVSDAQTAAAGLTGFGTDPFCSVIASFQAFMAEEPTAQVVEIVQNANVRTSTVAALKGDWTAAGAEGGAGAPRWDEMYPRLEYDGGAISGFEAEQTSWECTYLSAGLRICRAQIAGAELGADGEVWRVYERLEPSKAKEEIGRLLELPVAAKGGPESMDEARADWARRSGGQFGGGGASPMPEAGGARM